MGSRSAPRRGSSDPLRNMFGSDPGGTGPEWWSWLAFSMLGLLLVAFGYLGVRPGGDGPIWGSCRPVDTASSRSRVYREGPSRDALEVST